MSPARRTGPRLFAVAHFRRELPASMSRNLDLEVLIDYARQTRTSVTRPGSQMTSIFMGAQQTSQSSMVE